MPLNRVATAVITNLNNGRQITVEGLRITFNIVKTRKAADNKAKIKIYNLSEKSRSLIEAPISETGLTQTQVELSVGYRDTRQKLLFRGTGEAESKFAQPDWVTEIECNDGVDKLKSATYEKKFPAGTSVSNIITDMVKSIGLTTIISNAIPGILPKARAFSGDPLKNIQDLQSKFGFTFDIQDERAIIQPGNAPVNNRFKTILEAGSGLINEPRVQGNIVIAEALVNPTLIPNTFVELRSFDNPKVTGNYKILKGTFKGDTWQSGWSVLLELERLGVPSLFNLSDRVGGGTLA